MPRSTTSGAPDFSFVRLAVDPAYLGVDPARQALLIEQIARLERHKLAVVVALHPQSWHLETEPADRAALLATWKRLAPALRTQHPRLTFPEVLNEPVFPGDPDGWGRLQDAALAVIRAALPTSTIVLTGNDWGSIGGLRALHPAADPNVVYSFHFYEPPELTSLAAWRPGLDLTALARLPFPAADVSACQAGLGATDQATGDLERFYCAQRWSAAAIADRIAKAADWAHRNDAVLIAGEFGATARLNRAARLAWLNAVRRACEAQEIGWALWGYDDVMGLAVPRPPGSRPRLDAGVLRALGLSERQ